MNPNHDPSNGQFTSGSGGSKSGGKSSKRKGSGMITSKPDPAADRRIRAQAAARKAAEKARSDKSAADVIKYRMVGYKSPSQRSGYGG